MRKQIALLLCLLLLVPFAAGCAAAPEAPAETAAAAEDTAPAETAAPEITEKTPAEADPETEEPATTEDCGVNEEKAEESSHYSFQPKVCSSYMTELFGETMTETWFHLVDAVMAGEETFACQDTFTYDWVMGQYPDKCFPVLPELIDYCYDRDHPVVDGMASFTYLVSKEEAAARIAEFAALIEDILNILNADTQANEVGSNASLEQLLVAELAVGVRCRVEHAATGISHVGCDVDEL